MGGDLPQGLSQPAQRALASVGVKSLDDIARLSEKELLALHGMGPKAMRIIGHALHERGVNFTRKGLSNG